MSVQSFKKLYRLVSEKVEFISPKTGRLNNNIKCLLKNLRDSALLMFDSKSHPNPRHIPLLGDPNLKKKFYLVLRRTGQGDLGCCITPWPYRP